jgi:hypothetical protein
MKATLAGIVLLVMAIGGAAVGWQAARFAGGAALHAPALPQPTYRFRSEALKLEQIQQLGELVTLDVPVSDVQTSTLEGVTGSVSLVLLVRGSVQIGTDLEHAVLDRVDAEGRTAVLMLPAPRTSRPRLDHDRTHVYRNDRTGLWRLFPTPGAEAALYDRAMKQAQRLLEEAASQPELIDRARRRTAEVLLPFFAALAWQVELRWHDQPDADEAPIDPVKIMP